MNLLLLKKLCKQIPGTNLVYQTENYEPFILQLDNFYPNFKYFGNSIPNIKNGFFSWKFSVQIMTMSIRKWFFKLLLFAFITEGDHLGFENSILILGTRPHLYLFRGPCWSALNSYFALWVLETVDSLLLSLFISW